MDMLRSILVEGPVPLKKPQTPEQERAMLELVKWPPKRWRRS